MVKSGLYRSEIEIELPFSFPDLNFSPFSYFTSHHPKTSLSLSLHSITHTNQEMENLKNFSASELSLHTTKDDCWVLIHGKVYDVTKFLEEHPGGDDVLLHASASGDATDGFENVGHSPEAVSLMETLQIGTVEDYVAPHVASNSSGSSTKQATDSSPSPSFVEYLFAVLVVGFAIYGWYYLTFIAEKEE
ncbi:hypothetical protein LUZ60_007618 [Juncus effusus]|nr:hypothetical protein LUZ60_007618 [Juncus effusus]